MVSIQMRAFCFSVFVVTISTTAMAQDTIVEACQGGLNSGNYAEVSGQWVNGSDPTTERSSAPGLSPASGCASRKLNPGMPGEARFYPRFTTPGRYCVYITWPSSANVKQVLYVTRAGGNQTAKTIVQNGVGFRNPANGNKWIYLGEWDFAAGGDDFIAVQSVAKETAGHDSNKPGAMFVDAVRFTQKPLTSADGAELLPRDRVEMRGMGASVPPGAAPLLGVAPTGRAVAAAPSQPATPMGAGGGTAPTTFNPPAPPQSVGGGLPPGVDSSVGGITWLSSIQEAQRAAGGDKQKRILIYFHGKDSQLCMKYDREVFANAAVMKLLREKYVPVKIDLATNTEIANALGVFRGGTLLVYDSAGAGLKKITKDLEVQDALQELQF